MFENLNFFFNEGEQKDEYIRRKEEQRRREEAADRERFNRRCDGLKTYHIEPRLDIHRAKKNIDDIVFDKLIKDAEKTNIPKSEVISLKNLYKKSPFEFSKKVFELRHRNQEWFDLFRNSGALEAFDSLTRKKRTEINKNPIVKKIVIDNKRKYESTIFENVRFLDD